MRTIVRLAAFALLVALPLAAEDGPRNDFDYLLGDWKFTEGGSVSARHVLLATHVPLNDRGGLWAKMYCTRTYVVAAPIEPGQVTDALFWDTAYPYHYTRLLETGKGLYLIVGGEDRDVGKEGNDESRYEALEEYCRTHFGVTSFTHRWSGQINEPADMLPFIGESVHGKNVWMSTGRC